MRNVLVKAQATTQKGIAMRLLITISLALLMSATVSFSEEIRAECTVLVSYSLGLKKCQLNSITSFSMKLSSS